MDKPLYWSNKGGRYTQLALNMLWTTGYVQGKDIKIQSYADALEIDSEQDPITLLITMFAMLRENGEHAYFRIQDHSLYLITTSSFTSPASVISYRDDEDLCDSSTLYQFAPMYYGIPSDIYTIVFLFEPQIQDDRKEEFIELLNQALNTMRWKSIIPLLLDCMIVDSNELPSTIDVLNRCIAKTKLQRALDIIMQDLGCSFPPENDIYDYPPALET